MNWERAIGPGWDDPLMGQVPAVVGSGADPLLILAIVVAFAGLLIWICSQPPR